MHFDMFLFVNLMLTKLIDDANIILGIKPKVCRIQLDGSNSISW